MGEPLDTLSALCQRTNLLLFFSVEANERKCEGYINQVTVKSLDEKIMEKQARKEEKKLAKYAIREEPEEDKSKIDILDLRSKRYDLVLFKDNLAYT